MALTNRQLEVLTFIKRFIATNGYSPTVREIAGGPSLKSPSTIQDHLKKLVASGIITIDKRKSRTIELLVQNEFLKEDANIVKIPLLDSTTENKVIKEYLDIPVYMLNDYEVKNLYAYKEKNSIYIINVSLNRSGKPSVVIEKDRYVFKENPSCNIFGNVISEYKIY